MILRDFHVHTTYCDGKNSPEEMVLSAIEKNLECIGFSAHSYTFFDERYCIKNNNQYISEINALKTKYKDNIRILCGIEQDYYSDMQTSEYDYVIGSVHYIKIRNEYLEIDSDKESLIELVEKYFDGDYFALAEEYFKSVSKMADKIRPDIIGHLDLITKFNNDYELFDENNNRYKKAKKDAVDKILKLNIPFEINVGAISRGYKDVPYPDLDTISYIAKNAGKLVFSGDSHSKDTLCFQFEKWNNVLKENNIDYEKFCINIKP